MSEQVLQPPSLPRKVRVLCLHSFRTSGSIFLQQLTKAELVGRMSDLWDLTFADAPHAASGPIPRDVAPFFNPPHYEWFTVESVGDRLEFDEPKLRASEAHVVRLLREAAEQGRPFDGLMGFSQGAAMSSAIVALQRSGASPELAALPLLRFVILLGGLRSRYPGHVSAFESLGFKVPCPSLHIYGDKDALKNPYCAELADSFRNATVLLHQRGHVVPALPPSQLAVLRAFVQGAMQQDPEPIGPAAPLARQPTAARRAASGSDQRQEREQQQQQEAQERLQEGEVSRVLSGGADGQSFHEDGADARPTGRGREEEARAAGFGGGAARFGGGAARAPLRGRL